MCTHDPRNMIGKTVIITGGAGGIGSSLANLMLSLGSTVVLIDIDEEALTRATDGKDRCHQYVCDVTKPESVSYVINKIFAEHRRIDCLVNNVGVILNKPLVGMGTSGLEMHDIISWDKLISVNLSSMFYVTRSVVEKMIIHRTRGIIVNVSSICSVGNSGQSAYSAAKAGVNALTVTWAKELGLWGIRVAAVSPGFTDTQAARSSMAEQTIREWEKKTPLRRQATTIEIAQGIVFVFFNDFFNGKILEIDGGLRI